MTSPSPEAMLAALKRLADPDDECHVGYGGPWQDVAQIALFGRTLAAEEWLEEVPGQVIGRRLTIDEMLERYARK